MPDPVDAPTIEVPDDIAEVIGEEGDTGVVNFSVDLGAEEGEGPPSESIILIIGLTLLSVAPSLVIMLTSFTRIVIVFSLVRSALGVQSIPPNQVVVGLSLFLSLFIMGPTLDQMNEVGLQP
ncbi:MAG: flagellar type III secretion system pore protein FliP, partial [Acidimicrobiales bacterium]|nr:flagellar type III secretion system pore protein FliP [Acidimicrobiales bacterium]